MQVYCMEHALKSCLKLFPSCQYTCFRYSLISSRGLNSSRGLKQSETDKSIWRRFGTFVIVTCLKQKESVAFVIRGVCFHHGTLVIYRPPLLINKVFNLWGGVKHELEQCFGH